MAKFRKKPVVIEAVHFTNETVVAHVFDGAPLPDGVVLAAWRGHRGDRLVSMFDAHVETLEGRMKVSHGDWIIRGVKGVYPCKPDIFAATYEPADECFHQAWEENGGALVCADCRVYLGHVKASPPASAPYAGKAVAWGVPDGKGGVRFGKGWAFSPQCDESLGTTCALAVIDTKDDSHA